MFTPLFWTIITLILAEYALDIYIGSRNRKAAQQPIPAMLDGIYNNEKYRKQQAYFIANDKLETISNTANTAVLVLMFVVFGFGFFDTIARQITSLDQNSTWSTIMTGLVFFGLIFVGDLLINLPIDIYHTFGVEQRFGFNKSTPKLFALDKVKGFFISCILGGLILGLLMLCYIHTQEVFWLLGWVMMIAISVCAMMFYSSVIVPMFNKQTPLEEGELRSKIEEFCRSVDFEINNLYVLDSSTRTTKANAYFSGIGKKKRIVLFDTLISSLSTDEIVAVLAHEIGHYKHRHTHRMLLLNIAVFGIMFFILSLILKFDDTIAQTLYGTSTAQGSFWLSMIVFGVLFSPISTIMGILTNALSRKNEYQADNFAKEHGQAELLVSALKKLASSSLSNLTPDPLYISIHYSHPSLMQRIEALSK